MQNKSLIDTYEQAIEQNPDNRDLYWKLGIAYLIDGREEDAQVIWMSVLSEAEDESDVWTEELFRSLWNQALDCEKQGDLESSYLIYFYACEMNQTSILALLKLLQSAILCEKAEPLEGLILRLTEILETTNSSVSNEGVLLEVLSLVLEKIPACPGVGRLFKAAVFHVQDVFLLMQLILPHAVRIAHSLRDYSIAAEISEAYLLRDPDNYEFLGHLASFYQNAGSYEKGVITAKRHLEIAPDLISKIFSNHLVLRGLLSAGGRWNEAVETAQVHIQMLSSLNSEHTKNLLSVQTSRLFQSAYYLHYFKDSFENRRFLNGVNQLCQETVRSYASPFSHDRHLSKSRLNPDGASSNKIRVGYLSHGMCQHSVGWLARWLIKHHDRDRFELYGYFINDQPYDSLYQFYVQSFDCSSCLQTEFGQSTRAFAQKIYDDEINILIDLDSITVDASCEILAMKPAPIQATWLGWDAIGMDAIDYFIADPYVLPDYAQEYYTEKIWRLPETYLAVDGFEVAVPTLKRSDLKLPENAVTFLTAQRGYKRHRDTAILQLKIIARVPDAYLLIKGFADDQAIQNFFYEIADEIGVNHDRLRFLESDPSEAVHRANLRIADVVLDTYPYNGATTTMETLWMEVPIVTRVGEQFAARNSYTMMMNAGITEGIAWSAEEYIEWGIKLGTDAKLRQEVSWKLRKSKKTSPLWDGKKFARQMEDAYQQMYQLSIGHNQDDDQQDQLINSLAVLDTKIIIDAVFFQLYKTGIARLWKSLLEVWSKEEFRHNLLVLDRDGTCPRIPGINYRSVEALNYQDIDSDRSLLQAICEEEHADIFISTYYTTPIDTPSVLMGYDMIPEILNWDLQHPMWVSKQAAIAHASSYITISENTAKDLEKFYPQVSGSPITPALCGVAPYFYPASQLELMTFRERFNLRKPYFLLIGPSMGYKNAQLFLNGLTQLVSRQGFDVVCTGGSAPTFSTEARSLIPDVMFHPLSLNDDELRAAYSGAIALVYPSKYEGFGLPIVEAMKCNCPVITCANSSLPEVGGDAVLYVGDDDVNGMTNALLEVQSPNVRTQLIHLGGEQAKKFTWQNMGDTIKQCLFNQVKILREVDSVSIQKILILIDWTQDEEVTLESILKFLQIAQNLENLDSYEFVIDTDKISVEDADTFLSSGMMYFLMENEAPELAKLKIKLLAPQELDSKIIRKIVSKICLRDPNEIPSLIQKIPDFES